MGLTISCELLFLPMPSKPVFDRAVRRIFFTKRYEVTTLEIFLINVRYLKRVLGLHLWYYIYAVVSLTVLFMSLIVLVMTCRVWLRVSPAKC